MKTYEHKVISANYRGLADTLDKLSLEGWELVTCVYMGGYGYSYTLVVRREKTVSAT